MYQNLILLVINFFDFFHKKKIINFLKVLQIKNFDIFFDIGAHKGESIELFAKNFKIKKIFSFEPSPLNFKYLKKNKKKFKKKFSDTRIILENFALGSQNKLSTIKHFTESSSSTINDINENSNYFKKKYKLLNLFKKKKYYTNLKIKIIKLSEYLKIKKLKK